MKITTVLLVLLLLQTFVGCNKDEEMQSSLVITTVDDSGIRISGVNVELYPSLTDWLNETSKIYETRESDSDGLITYIEIDTGQYYINAYKGSDNNWENEVKKNIIRGFQNTTNVTVSESSSGKLSDAKGKKWILDSYFSNGQDAYSFLEDCILDDTLLFYKGVGFGAHVISRGSLKCNQFQEDNINGLWTLSDNNDLLQIQFGNEIINWNIDTLKVEKLSVNYVETGNIINVSYTPVE